MERRKKYLFIYLIWLFLLLVPVFPIASGQYDSNYANTCQNGNPPNTTCEMQMHGESQVYVKGTYVSMDDCNIPNAICARWTNYASAVTALLPIPIAGFLYTANSEPCYGLFCGLAVFGEMIMAVIDFGLVIIPLIFLLHKTQQ